MKITQNYPSSYTSSKPKKGLATFNKQNSICIASNNLSYVSIFEYVRLAVYKENNDRYCITSMQQGPKWTETNK